MLVLGRRQFVGVGSGVCMDDTPLLESIALCEPRANMVWPRPDVLFERSYIHFSSHSTFLVAILEPDP